MLKTVTLQEANGLLPLVCERLFRIHLALMHLKSMQEKINNRKPKLMLDKSNENISIKYKKHYEKRLKSTFKKLEYVEMLVEKDLRSLTKFGAVIKGFSPIHVDFLSTRNNEPVYLCWHGGEKEIAHWHYLDDGSPHRQCIHEKNNFGFHMVH